MPSKSKKQHNFMAAVANNPKFAKKAGVPQSVGKDYTEADKMKKGNKVKYNEGGDIEKKPPSMTNEEYLQFVKDKVQKEEGETKKAAKAKYNREYKRSLREYGRRKGRGESEKNFLDKAGDWTRDNIGGAFNSNRITSQDDKARMQARKDILGFKKGGTVRGAGKAIKGIRPCKIR